MPKLNKLSLSSKDALIDGTNKDTHVKILIDNYLDEYFSVEVSGKFVSAQMLLFSLATAAVRIITTISGGDKVSDKKMLTQISDMMATVYSYSGDLCKQKPAKSTSKSNVKGKSKPIKAGPKKNKK